MKLRIDTARVRSDLTSCGKSTLACLIQTVPIGLAFVVSLLVIALIFLFLYGMIDLLSDGLTPRNIIFICLLPSIIVITCLCFFCRYVMQNWVIREADPPVPD